MGFRSLAIQQRSSEVWEVLGAVKTEFVKYADVLAKVKKKLNEATNTIDHAEMRTRAIQKKLRHVEGPIDLPIQIGVPAEEDVSGNDVLELAAVLIED